MKCKVVCPEIQVLHMIDKKVANLFYKSVLYVLDVLKFVKMMH